jgi:non-specific serine/threonine protein kinase
MIEERRERSDPVPHEGELERLAAAAPPIPGGEYLTADLLRALWKDVVDPWRVEIAAATGTVRA